MARVTIEDCIKNIENRFDLVVVAARRAREVAAGAPITVERDNDKNPVVALREIAEGTLDISQLRESVVKGMQRAVLSSAFAHGMDEGDVEEDTFQANQWGAGQGKQDNIK